MDIAEQLKAAAEGDQEARAWLERLRAEAARIAGEIREWNEAGGILAEAAASLSLIASIRAFEQEFILDMVPRQSPEEIRRQMAREFTEMVGEIMRETEAARAQREMRMFDQAFAEAVTRNGAAELALSIEAAILEDAPAPPYRM